MSKYKDIDRVEIFQMLLDQHQITKDVMIEQYDLDLTGYLEKLENDTFT